MLRRAERGELREHDLLAGSKEVIIRGGINIYPREIEDVLFDHDAIAQVAVVGLPDEKLGECVAAAIQLKDPSSPLLAGELRAYCRERLASYKAPVQWFFLDGLPTTAPGKVQKYVLQQRILAGELHQASGATT